MMARLLAGAALAGCLLLAAGQAWAEYRAYELEVTDILDCRLNKREKCKRFQVLTAMAPDLYVGTHGGQERVGVILLATWVCRGDTSGYRAVCPRPAPHDPKFAVGDTVTVKLKKHISEGWRGKVEIAYYHRAVTSNVYGVRFSDRQDVYGRYFEKDLEKAGVAPAAAPSTGQAPAAAPAAGQTTGAAPAATAPAIGQAPAGAAPATGQAPAAAAPAAGTPAPAPSTGQASP